MIRVLIVDDKPENLYMLRALLQGHGCAVEEARHGAEALTRGRQVPPDLVISDLLMPVMDGYTLLRHWKADDRLNSIPFVVYTATYTESKDEKLAMDLGADAFIIKPVEPEPLMARLLDVLAKAQRQELPPVRAPQADPEALLNEYTEVIIRKLEEKSLQLEQANRALREELAQRRQAEESLRQSEEQFRAMFEMASIGMAQADVRTGQWLHVNEKLCAITGYTAEEMLRLRVSEITHPEDRDAGWKAFEGVVRGDAPDYRMEGRYLRKDGRLVWVNVNMTVIRGPDGQPLRTIAAIEDITARKLAEEERARLEAQLRQQQKLEAIGTLASGVAHEINNPITGIMNYAELIECAVAPDHRAAAHAREIVSEAERVASIVQNLLQFARQERQSHSPARLADIVQRTLSLLGAVLRRDQIALSVDVPEDLPSIRCRSQQIQQVLMNLLTNARDALNERFPDFHEDKTIRVSVRPLEHNARRWLRLTVADRGCGIPAEIRERIFDPFFTTKPRDKGTGLGLSVSHGIVKEHHGVLHFETELGTGTQFHLDLPVEDERTGEAE